MIIQKRTWKCPICKTERSCKGVCYTCQINRKLEYQDYLEKLESKRKYRKGDKISNFEELRNCQFVYWNDKIYHTAFIESLQLRVVERLIDCGNLYFAVGKE
jgi:hypothetical protein